MTTTSSLNALAEVLDESPGRLTEPDVARHLRAEVTALREALPRQVDMLGIGRDHALRWVDDLEGLIDRANNGALIPAAADLAIGLYAAAFLLGADENALRDAVERGELLALFCDTI